MFTDNEHAATSATDRKRVGITDWFTARADAMRGFVRGLVDQVVEIATAIGDAIKRGVDTLVSAVTDTIGWVVDGVNGLVHRIPDPHLPVVSDIRGAVVGVVDWVTGAIHTALDAVRNFVNYVVAEVVDCVVGLVELAGQAIMYVLDSFLAIVARAVAWIDRQLTTVANRIAGVLRSSRTTSISQIDRAEAIALAQVATNQRQGQQSIEQIMEFSYGGGDSPSDATVASHLDAVDDTPDKTLFETSVRAAMGATTKQVQSGNTQILAGVRTAVSRVCTLAVGTATRVVRELGDSAQRALDGLRTRLGMADSRMKDEVGGVVTKTTTGLRGMVGGMAGTLGLARNSTMAVTRSPTTALSNLAGTILNRAADFVGQMASL